MFAALSLMTKSSSSESRFIIKSASGIFLIYYYSCLGRSAPLRKSLSFVYLFWLSFLLASYNCGYYIEKRVEFLGFD